MSLYKRYVDNVWNNRKKIIPVRMDGRKAAVYISKLGIQPDLIYLDMGHSYEEVIGDLNVITREFPNVIIVGDDYLYWTGVRKAVLETRYRLNIPYLNIDKNCYALLYGKQEKYMTYNNNIFGKKIKRFYDKTIKKYTFEEIQYSLIPSYVSNTTRVFIIPIYKSSDINLYKHLFNQNNKIYIIVLSKKKESLYSIYNYGYIYFNDKLKKDGKEYTYIFIDPEQIVDIKDYKCCDGILSITTIKDINQEVYSSLGNLSINEKCMKQIKYFPHDIQDLLINRYFFFKTITDNKFIIYQSFIKKNMNDTELDFNKLYSSLSNKKRKYYSTYNNKNHTVNLHILDKKILSQNIHIIIV